jgi:Glycosyltransferase family 25 (LPS biosynthesis protein)
MFDRVVCVNLARRPDRLEAFWRNIESIKGGWPFVKPEVFPAFDGALVPHPKTWVGGDGARGCLLSHRNIIERAYQDGIKSLLILEDDVEFHEDFRERALSFAENIPDNWEGMYFGCQHRKEPKNVKPGIVRSMGSQRTHAYGMRARWMRDYYLATYTWETHIDHLIEQMCPRYRIYCPDPQIVFQSGGKSDIDFNDYVAPRDWNGAVNQRVLYLKCSRSTMGELRKQGIHTGFNRNDDGVDCGLVAAMSRDNDRFRRYALGRLMNILREESSMIHHGVAAIWNPALTASEEAIVRAVGGDDLVELLGDSPEEIMQQLKEATCLL